MADWSGGFDCEFVEKPPRTIQIECPICLVVESPTMSPVVGTDFVECVLSESGKVTPLARVARRENFLVLKTRG